MKERTREEPRILAAAERQMQAWALTHQIAERMLHGGQRVASRLNDFIAISREAGACGGQVAQLIGRRLGWQVLDKNLLDEMADRYRLPRPMLELVDETTANWVFDIFGTWFDRRIISHEKYLVHLSRVVVAAARQGNVIFVGRAAQFLLPRQHGLAVRIVAPEKYRAEQIMRRLGVSAAEARRFIAEVDRGRREFVAHFFHRDIADPHLYDLVINVQRIGLAGAAEQILDAYRRCAGEARPPVAPPASGR